MTFSNNSFIRELQIKRRVETFKENYRLGKFKHHMLGKHHSVETKLKISKAHLGKKCCWLRGENNPSKRPEVRLKISLAAQNRRWSDEYKKIRSIKYSGTGNPYYGKKHSKIVRQKISSAACFRHANGLGYPFWIHNNISGKNNCNWNGGISKEKYGVGWNCKLKELVRARFGRKCLMCFRQEYGRNLEVHHIDYNPQNCGLNNLVPLHAVCHGKIKGCLKNRLYWRNHFQEMMRELT